jgi:hypothetical protein
MEKNGSALSSNKMRLKMERFYDDDDQNDEKESFFNEENQYYEEENEEEEIVGYMDQQGILDVMHMDIDQSKINQGILEKSINVAKSSWFWNFTNIDDKLKIIEKIFFKLTEITEKNKEEEEDNDDYYEREEKKEE